MTNREQIAAAMRDGAAAAHAGEPMTDCPYRLDGDGLEDLLGRLWCRAYDRVAGLPITYDEHTEDQG